ncbi:MAG: outer membrane protein assembly factor BamD [Arenimonas sp.]
MIRLSTVFRFTLCVALVLSLPGCKTVGHWFGGDREDRTERLEVEQLYAEARDDMRSGDNSQAQRYYTRLIARFPFGPYSEQAQLELAYVQHKLGKPDDATASIDRFIRTYPRHPHIDYAYYLKAVINFDRNVGLLTRVFRTDPSMRDLNGPTISFSDFNEVLRRYPHSIYAADARQRMVYLRNELARHEVVVGLYYYRRGAWVSSANRGKYLLENYPQSQYEGDGIALMAASYKALGQTALADDARRVLEKNYPEHPYLSGKWPRYKSFFRKLNPFAGELH